MRSVTGEVRARQVGEALWVVGLLGEHDVSTASELRRQVAAIHEHGTSIVFDLSEASFVESQILGVIANASDRAEHRPADGVAIVAPVGSAAQRVLTLVRMDTRVPICEDVDAAVALLSARDDQRDADAV